MTGSKTGNLRTRYTVEPWASVVGPDVLTAKCVISRVFAHDSDAEVMTDARFAPMAYRLLHQDPAEFHHAEREY